MGASRAAVELGPREELPALIRRLQRRLAMIGLGSNGFGGVVVAGFLFYMSPNTLEGDELTDVFSLNGAVFVAYMAVTLPLGRHFVALKPWRPIEEWLESGRPATEEERRMILRYPLNWAVNSAPYWAGAAILFGVLNLGFDLSVALVIAVTIVLGGLTACALQYLLVERELRPVTALALAGGQPPSEYTPGVRARLTMAWALATAVPLLGAIAFAAADVLGAELDRQQLVPAILSLCLLALATGFVAMWFSAHAVAEPLEIMRAKLARVEEGDFATRVDVEDGSEVGLLQAGFNRMVSGLGEREALREAFGAFVDPALTERVLERGTDLAGEAVELSVMFMDVRGFTSFSERAEPHEVVATLNALYAEVVPVILRHGGHANKFIGDGLLAIFGAPDRLPDHADRAVAAAAELIAAVAKRFGGELRIGVGVNSGPVIAGTIGGGGRVDFTVIGDTVNTAARVESATRETGDELLITETTRRLLREPGEWIERSAIPLKGKRQEVHLFAPA